MSQNKKKIYRPKIGDRVQLVGNPDRQGEVVNYVRGWSYPWRVQWDGLGEANYHFTQLERANETPEPYESWFVDVAA